MLSPTSNNETNKGILESEMKLLFPEIIDDKIKTLEFLSAARGIVRIVGTFYYYACKFEFTSE